MSDLYIDCLTSLGHTCWYYVLIFWRCWTCRWVTHWMSWGWWFDKKKKAKQIATYCIGLPTWWYPRWAAMGLEDRIWRQRQISRENLNNSKWEKELSGVDHCEVSLISFVGDCVCGCVCCSLTANLLFDFLGGVKPVLQVTGGIQTHSGWFHEWVETEGYQSLFLWRCVLFCFFIIRHVVMLRNCHGQKKDTEKLSESDFSHQWKKNIICCLLTSSLNYSMVLAL